MAAIVVACKAGSGRGLDVNGRPLDEGVGKVDDAFSEVQTIFTSRCIVCHAGAAAPQGLSLEKGAAFSALVNVPSNQQPELARILPGDPESSYLVRKIRGDTSITGNQMPRNGPPFLSESQIQIIIDWVIQGAPGPSELDPNAEYIAGLNDFIHYKNWKSVDYSIGATNLALSFAHNGEENQFVRRVYSNEIANQSNDRAYANGSILVKEVFSYETGEKEFAGMGGLLAMVKRGGEFNSTNGGWEWFDLASDLSSISGRGDGLMDGMCNVCHQQAELEGGMDFVFKHPSEFIAAEKDFSDYKSWVLIDERNDTNPLLDGFAHGADEPVLTRKVYKKQNYANPDSISQGYPIGTILLKESSDSSGVREITAMAKRGGNFNSEHGNWEWFMLDPENISIALLNNGELARGENLMNGACNACHLAANTLSGWGIDYVFKHIGDPFNNHEEFVAELSDFTNYKAWPVVDYTIGAVNGAIGGGHQGENMEYSRRVYSNDTALSFEGGQYPKGSVFIKEVVTWAGGLREFSPQLGLVAMVKRGGNFNVEHNGWEWFELETDLSQVVGRAGDYRNGGCNNCHRQAEDEIHGADYVFKHPSEFIAENAHFEGYQNWALIEERADSNIVLSDGAHQVDDTNSIRRIYKKQLYAAPEQSGFGFPIGTTFVKEVLSGDDIIEIVAMVKRGGTYNSGHQHWEWFMLNPMTKMIGLNAQNQLLRGADLMDGMCSNCHSQAISGSGLGVDYVFYHENDPLNNNRPSNNLLNNGE